MRSGLSLDEFVELGHVQPRTEKGLLTLPQAVEHIRRRGYDCQSSTLAEMAKRELIGSDNSFWSKDKIEAVCEFCELQWFFLPYVVMCRVLGCRYFTYLKALRDVAKRESEKYGIRVLEDDWLFVMHREPAREGHESIIRFTLCSDIQARLERGEGV